jgi:pimeloyl-ACP methyl ester carboxylesterase
MIFDYDGKKIRFEITGVGPPILFLHGLGGNMNNWMLQRGYFSKTHRVVTLDLPGHDQSEGRDVAFKEYWRVINALLEYLDVGPCTLCGLSMGARVAIDVASRGPVHVARLIVVNTFLNLTLSDKRARIALYDLLGRDDGGRLWSENILLEMGIQNDSAIARGFFRSLTQIYPHHIRSLFSELIAYDQRGELSTIQCPTFEYQGFAGQVRAGVLFPGIAQTHPRLRADLPELVRTSSLSGESSPV